MRIFGVNLSLFRRMWRSRWLRVPLIILGVLSIFAAIWFGFAMTGSAFLSQVWVRAGLIGLILFVIFLVWFIKWRRRRKAAQALEDSLMPEEVGDGTVLAERMQEALDKLKKSGGKTYLYDLPWYIIIGPPGAGKTTALKNSGIEFPGTDVEAIEGFGGTKNCDWWFAEDAILIDTAGRYTTQDSDAAADEASWSAFLDLLKSGRPNQPINGVILAFSAEDMMTAGSEMLEHHAKTVRARLGEIHDRLKIDFPVYVMFTKADMISGFREYFSSFSQSRRKAVWGVTFQTKDRNAQTFQNVPEEFDALVSRLSDEVIDRMSEEPDGISRIAIFGLPGQMALLRDNISEFLRRVFEPTRYKTNAILRGFYFTSGTQEGTPIDQVLGAMARNDDASAAFQPAFMSGKGKSYFLHDLLKKVIFEESDWVGHDAGAVRRAMILRTAALVLIGLITVGAMGAFGYSYWQNATLVRTADVEADSYFGGAQTEINRTLIDDTNPSIVLPHLERIRIMTAGYGDVREASFWQGLGLGQRSRINLAAERAYSDALERKLRPRMILHMENEIPQLIADDDTAGVYRALKVYILLGGQQDGKSDDDAIRAYFADVWRQEFRSAGQFDERDQLDAHLAAMLELDDDRPLRADGSAMQIGIDAEIVRDAQEAIVNLPLAEQAYASIKDRAISAGVPDFNFVARVGGQVARVFETADDTPLEEVSVSGLFTFEGYWGFFLEELTNARARLEEDQWVLGDAAQRVGYEQQLGSLERELHRAYQLDFSRAWEEMFANLALAPMSADPPNYDVLEAAASPVASPFLEVVEAVEEETRLTRLYDQIENLSVEDLAAGGELGSRLGDAAISRVWARSSSLQRIVIESVRDGEKAQDRAGGGGALAEDTQRRQVERITEEFEVWHLMLRGDQGARPIDAVLAGLGEVRVNRRNAAIAPTPIDEQNLQAILSSLTANNSSLPEPLGGWLNEAEGEFRSVAQDATMAELNRALNEQVSQFCNDFIGPLFPFGGGRHVSPSVFGQFFGPNGRMDQYYTTYLQPHVIRTSDGLQPAPGSAIGDRLNPGTLRQFERAERIRLAFFASGNPEPEVGLSVTHVSSSPTVELAILQLNGGSIQTQPDGAPAALNWPGAAGGVQIELFPQEVGRSSSASFSDGRWAIVDFLRRGRANVSGNVATVTHQVGGRTITYRIEFDSTTVPFLMSELSDFSCPVSLE